MPNTKYKDRVFEPGTDHRNDPVADSAEGREWKWEEDGMTVIRTHARTFPGCHDNCGILVYVKDGVIDHVEGDPENPYNEGRLCLRCLAVKEMIYHPNRITYPMKRDKSKRGDADAWERITWDEAYDIIYEEMMKVIEKYGAQSIYVTQGTGRDINGYNAIAAHYLGSPNNGMGFLSGNSCYAPRNFSTAFKLGGFFIADYGQFFPDRCNDPRFSPPEYILIWGNNPVVANSDGSLGYWIVECMKRGSKLITVDPKLTWLAGKSDYWFQIRPGTDGALILGMCKAIIDAGLQDQDFIDRWTYGYEAFAERCSSFDVEYAAEICGVDAGKIVEAAHAIAKAENVVLQWGVAFDHQQEGFIAGMAALDLFALTGNFEKPGTMVSANPCFGVGETWMPVNDFLEEIPDPPYKADPSTRMNQDFPALKAIGIISQDMLLKAMETGEPYPVKATWLQTNNPITNMGAEPQRILPALLQCDFNVIVDLFMTPTCLACGDVFLPACSYAERIGLIGHQPYVLGSMHQCIEPLGESRSDQQIIVGLGKRFMGEEGAPWETMEDFYDYILRKTPFDYQEIYDRTWAYPEFEYNKHEKGLLRADGQPGFNTQYGRYNFYCAPMQMFGFDPLVSYEEPYESPVSTPELFKEYPIILTTGARRWGLFHSEHRQAPSMRQFHSEPFVILHPDTAAQYGLEDGDMVKIENMFGECKQRLQIDSRIKPGVASADHGWWFPERDPHDGTLFGVMESNINKLLPMRPGKTGLGSSYKSQLCRITKVEE